jgi:hypothetical protein
MFQVHDIELNREFFDIPTANLPSTASDKQEKTPEKEIHLIAKKKDIETHQMNYFEEIPEIDITTFPKESKVEEVAACVLQEDVSVKTPTSPKRFDSVKNLLEKARQKLLMTKNFLTHRSQKTKESSKIKSKLIESDNQLKLIEIDNQPIRTQDQQPDPASNETQSSPSTPAQLRKNSSKRNRSFSPVR